uniref:hypothetical protein n=1 Tax=Thaumasiovibrio occultus TaxID=1891184 RepID=UPI000B35034E|nr:hypothetical protein [Thaumasiovibrio occultus]
MFKPVLIAWSADRKAFIFLQLCYALLVLQNLSVLFFYHDETDYFIYSIHGLAPLLFLIVSASLVLNVLTVYYFNCRMLKGYYTALMSLVLLWGQGILSVSLAMQDIEAVRAAYRVGRGLRGLHDDTAATLSTNSMLTMLVGLSVMYLVILLFVLRSKDYLLVDDEEPL